jgi:hypothetical protein
MTENLVVGRGKVYFAPYLRGATTGGVKGFFGNVPEFSLAQNVTNLDHYRSTGGLKIKDRTVQLQVDATITFSTDNISIANLQLWFGGSSTGSLPSDAPTDIGAATIIGSSSQIYGALFYESDNPVGDNINIWAPLVSLRPNANYGLIADTWQSLGFIAECLKRDESTERVYVFTPSGGAASSDAALDTSPTYISQASIDVASTPATPASSATVTAHGGVAAAASTVEFTLSGGDEAWGFYHNGTVKVGSAHILVGASGAISTVLPVAGTYTFKAYGDSAGSGSAIGTSSSITVS